MNNMKDSNDAMALVDKLQSIYNRIEKLDKLVIAAVNGYCLGAGCELAIACDIRIATPNSIFGLPEVKLGLLPMAGATYRLPALIGIGRTKELILCGDQINADEALRIGLINRIVNKESLIKEAMKIATKTNQDSYNAIKNGKIAINSIVKRNDEIEKESFVSCFNHNDRKEGLGAFIAKKKPKFE
jgi:enoyl-CoA hydratase